MGSTDQGPDRGTATATPPVFPTFGDYVDLLRAFMAGELTGVEFERRYLDLFSDDSSLWPEPTFRVLNDLFFAVDAYCPDPALRDEEDLDEEQLRVRVRAALASLAS